MYNVNHRYAICLKFGDKFLLPALQSKKIYSYIVLSFRHLLSFNLTYFCNKEISKETPLVIQTINFTIESLVFENRHLTVAHFISDIKLS